MHYYLLREKQQQNQFKFFWAEGKDNHADYTTKHHSPQHHIQTRQEKQYVRDRQPISPKPLQF